MLLIKKKVYLIDESLLYMSLLRGKVKNLQSVLVLFSFFLKKMCIIRIRIVIINFRVFSNENKHNSKVGKAIASF